MIKFLMRALLFQLKVYISLVTVCGTNSGNLMERVGQSNITNTKDKSSKNYCNVLMDTWRGRESLKQIPSGHGAQFHDPEIMNLIFFV